MGGGIYHLRRTGSTKQYIGTSKKRKNKITKTVGYSPVANIMKLFSCTFKMVRDFFMRLARAQSDLTSPGVSF